MIDPSKVRFPRINRAFLQGLFWLLVFLFLASILNVARGIYDRFVVRPEVRREIIAPNPDIQLDNQLWLQRIITIKNRGNGDAKNVYANISALNGHITRFEIISDENYKLNSDDATDNRTHLSLSLDRLASGAQIVVFLWAVHPAGDNTSPIAISAVFDGGVAEVSNRPTALEEIRGMGDILLSGVTSSWFRFQKRAQASELSRTIVAILPFFGVRNLTIPDNDPEFRSALISTLLIIFGAWLLMRRERAVVVMAVVIGLFLWLFVDFYVGLLTLLFLSALAAVAFFFSDNGNERIILAVSTLVVWLTIFDSRCIAALSDLGRLWSFWNCSYGEANGGAVVGYLWLIIYLTLTEA